MKRLKEQLAATGCRSVKEWLDTHPGQEFELWLPGVTAYFTRWSETQGQILFKGRGDVKTLRYLNPKSPLHGAKMEVVIRYDAIEDEFSAAEEEASAAESSYRSSPAKWGRRPSPAHIIYRYLARKDEAFWEKDKGANK